MATLETVQQRQFITRYVSGHEPAVEIRALEQFGDGQFSQVDRADVFENRAGPDERGPYTGDDRYTTAGTSERGHPPEPRDPVCQILDSAYSLSAVSSLRASRIAALGSDDRGHVPVFKPAK